MITTQVFFAFLVLMALSMIGHLLITALDFGCHGLLTGKRGEKKVSDHVLDRVLGHALIVSFSFMCTITFLALSYLFFSMVMHVPLYPYLEGEMKLVTEMLMAGTFSAFTLLVYALLCYGAYFKPNLNLGIWQCFFWYKQQS